MQLVVLIAQKTADHQCKYVNKLENWADEILCFGFVVEVVSLTSSTSIRHEKMS